MSHDGATRLLKALRALDEMAEEAAVRDRRVHSRFRVRGEGTLIFDPHLELGAEKPGQLVHIRDVSRGGFGLLCSSRVEERRVSRLVCVAEGVELGSVLIMPTHVSEVMDGVFLAGCTMVLDASMLIALGVRPHEIVLSEDRPIASPTDGDFSTVSDPSSPGAIGT